MSLFFVPAIIHSRLRPRSSLVFAKKRSLRSRLGWAVGNGLTQSAADLVGRSAWLSSRCLLLPLRRLLEQLVQIGIGFDLQHGEAEQHLLPALVAPADLCARI